MDHFEYLKIEFFDEGMFLYRKLAFLYELFNSIDN